MFLFRLKRLVMERDVLLSIFIFGLLTMVADIFGDLELKSYAVGVRVFGVTLIVFLVWGGRRLQEKYKDLPSPLMFSEKPGQQEYRAAFRRFQSAMDLEANVKVIEAATNLKEDDLVVTCNGGELRASKDGAIWRNNWLQMARQWRYDIDRSLASRMFGSESRQYHIYPHAPVVISFALGALVNDRRPVVLYHQQDDQFHRVIDLIQPRRILESPPNDAPKPRRESLPAAISATPRKLILHIKTNSRHSLDFKLHPDYAAADNEALIYEGLDPQTSWLPLAQALREEMQRLVQGYDQVELCLNTTSALAFALGMAFSRNPRVALCHLFENSYTAVFSLVETERHLFFD